MADSVPLRPWRRARQVGGSDRARCRRSGARGARRTGRIIRSKPSAVHIYSLRLPSGCSAFLTRPGRTP